MLDAEGSHPPRLVLERAAAGISQIRPANLRAGVGSPFSGLDQFSSSYREAQRALRHTSAERPFVFGRRDISLFDELTISAREDAHLLIPEAIRELLADNSLGDTIEAFFAADSRSRSRPGLSRCTRTRCATGSAGLPS